MDTQPSSMTFHHDRVGDRPAVWPPALGRRADLLRGSHGLYAGADGWYVHYRGKKRYVSKPASLDRAVEALAALKARVDNLPEPVVQVRTKPLASISLERLVEIYLAHLLKRVETGQPRKLSRRTYSEILQTLRRFCTVVDARQRAADANPTWFSTFAATLQDKAATTRQREVIYLTAFFDWAGPGRNRLNFYREPVLFGPDFHKPSASAIRASLDQRSKLISVDALHAAFAAVAQCPVLYAAGLLALNGAYLPVDVVQVPLKHLHLDAPIPHADYPRGKNNIDRKTVLWPETVVALRRCLTLWPVTEAAEPVFRRQDGQPWSRHAVRPDGTIDSGNALSRYWALATGTPLAGMRTTFATVAANAGCDLDAVRVAMGHGAKDVLHKNYVRSFDLTRCRAVADAVRGWLGDVPPLSASATTSAAALTRPRRDAWRAARRPAPTAPDGSAVSPPTGGGSPATPAPPTSPAP
jgi:hypothetical protein